MREIKFRAWDAEDRVMFYSRPGDFTVVVADRPEKTYGVIMQGALSVVAKLHPPLMQFTGLRDCRGNEIYEGDFLAHRTRDSFDFPQGPVGFCNGAFMGQWLGRKNHGERLTARLARHFQVVGNVYENPALLR